jgi:hypothetical protein
MARNSLMITTKKKTCIEENIFLEGHGVLKYSLSNILDDIKIAIITRTGNFIDLEEAIWTLNTRLSVKVKQLMTSHNVNFSMTTFTTGEVKKLVVNMRVGESWFIAGYDEIEGEFINWELIRINAIAHQLAKDMLNDFVSSREYG